MWHPAGRLPFHCALLPPRLKIFHLRDGSGILDPLYNLCHRYKVNVVVVRQNLIYPVEEGVKEFRVVLEPGCMEIETQWGAVLLVMAIEVVVEEIVKLVASEDVGARIHHSASGQVLIKLRIFSAIQLVHHHFPHRMASSGAVLQVTMTPVWHAEVHGVWPQWRVGERRCDSRVVQKSLFLHHGELVITTHAQVWRADTYDAVVGKVGEFLDDDSCTSHFFSPVVDRGVAPELLIVIVPKTKEFLDFKPKF